MENKELAAPANNYLGLGFADIKNVAQALSATGIFEDAKDAGVAFAKILAGQEMGLTPFKAMQEISFIKGKPSLSSNAKAAAIKTSGRYNYEVRSWDNTHCEIEFFENGKSKGKIDYTQADAKLAGVYDRNPNYKTNPKAMYFAGAIRQGQRAFCPDATNGISTYDREEIIEAQVVEPVAETQAPDANSPAPIPDKPSPAKPEVEIAATEPESDRATAVQLRKIMALTRDIVGSDPDNQKAFVYSLAQVESRTEITKSKANDLIYRLENPSEEDQEMIEFFKTSKKEDGDVHFE